MPPHSRLSFNKGFYYVARGLQVVGLLITFKAFVEFFFPENKMGPLLEETAVGVVTFSVGWLMQR